MSNRRVIAAGFVLNAVFSCVFIRAMEQESTIGGQIKKAQDGLLSAIDRPDKEFFRLEMKRKWSLAGLGLSLVGHTVFGATIVPVFMACTMAEKKCPDSRISRAAPWILGSYIALWVGCLYGSIKTGLSLYRFNTQKDKTIKVALESDGINGALIDYRLLANRLNDYPGVELEDNFIGQFSENNEKLKKSPCLQQANKEFHKALESVSKKLKPIQVPAQ